MKKFLSCYYILPALLFATSCSTTHKTPAENKTAPVADTYDPYALAPADTVSVPENAIVVTPPNYHPSFTIVNDLVHTKLDVKFDWAKTALMGKAWITLKPHFYPTDSLRLDAKGFDIHKVELVVAKGSIPLAYTYDSSFISIKLNKLYAKDEQYTVYIDYTAKPNDLKVKGSVAINDARGLYFINPDNSDPSKPRQLWTQGETESNSGWFPTIDKPNMKMTTELSMTVEKGFVTLSNGLMTSSKDNGDGTHTDTWKLDLPYAPYLVMMAAGPFAVVKDHWKNMEVNYYLDKKYEPYARKIFGNTPEMIDFFSTRLNVPYAWPKYSQVVVHDFVSGAMENVTATVHFDKLNQTAREMIDENREDIISHELFHQWFGDLVTCESWSNISLNESFATYGEYLWNEHKYGKDEADYKLNNDLEDYLYTSKSVSEPLIRFNYADKEEVFDGISYQKGGRILHMLRNVVGDDAFFQSLKKYLDDNRFGTGEVHQLRLAFEKVTGQDLNWFFNEWYLSKGHPVLDIHYNYDASAKEETVKIDQLQNTADGIPVFRVPMKVDIYSGGTVTRHSIVLEDASQSFSFPVAVKPDLVNLDADKVLVCEKTDNKSDTVFAFQINHAPLFLDRLEAIHFFSENTRSPFYSQVMLRGMNDPMWVIRSTATESARVKNADNKTDEALKQKIITLASTDPNSHVRAAAVEQAGKWHDQSMIPLLQHALADSSYLVISTALQSIMNLDSVKAYQAAAALEGDSSEEIVKALASVYARMGGPEKNTFLLNQVNKSDISYNTVISYGQYIARFVDHPQLIDASLPSLYRIAQHDSRWYVRFAAINALENLHTSMATQKETWDNELLQTEKEMDEWHKLTSNLEWLTNTMASLEEKIQSIKAAETDENLKRMYGSQ